MRKLSNICGIAEIVCVRVDIKGVILPGHEVDRIEMVKWDKVILQDREVVQGEIMDKDIAKDFKDATLPDHEVVQGAVVE